MYKRISFALLVFALTCTNALGQSRSQDTSAVDATLNNLHDAASKADYERYFSQYSDQAVFFGTDASERWTIDQFKAYAKPHFVKGKGWTYKKISRNIYISKDRNTAWFDEMLDNNNYGECRGTGVLIREGEQWKIAQYHLVIPVPNELANEFVAQVRALKKQP